MGLRIICEGLGIGVIDAGQTFRNLQGKSVLEVNARELAFYSLD